MKRSCSSTQNSTTALAKSSRFGSYVLTKLHCQLSHSLNQLRFRRFVQSLELRTSLWPTPCRRGSMHGCLVLMPCLCSHDRRLKPRQLAPFSSSSPYPCPLALLRRKRCRAPRRALHRHHLAPACSILRRAPLTHPLAHALLCMAGGSKAWLYFAFRRLNIALAPPSSLPCRGQRIWTLSHSFSVAFQYPLR
jgi:hypothetical protein